MSEEYFVEIEYTCSIDNLSLTHTQALRVLPSIGQNLPSNIGIDFGSVLIQTWAGVGATQDATLDSLLSGYLTAFCELYSADMNVLNARLTYYEFGGGANGATIGIADFQDAVTYPDLQGTNVTALTKGQQVTISLFNSRGNTGRIVVLEPSISGNEIYSPANIPSEYDTYISEFTGTGGWVLGTQNAFYLQATKVLATQNEAIQNKRFRA